MNVIVECLQKVGLLEILVICYCGVHLTEMGEAVIRKCKFSRARGVKED